MLDCIEEPETRAIPPINNPETRCEPLLALSFAPGSRPGRAEILRCASDIRKFSVIQSPDGGEDWIEILITGLTFEIEGLAPGAPLGLPGIDHRFGLAGGQPAAAAETIVLRPGPHLAGGEAMLPVVRACTSVALALVMQAKPLAVSWLPAAIALDPDYFAGIASAWLDGGPFPALGYTALVGTSEGGIASAGLAFFTGQEIDVEPAVPPDPRRDARLAVRAIDALVGHGPLTSPLEMAGPEGELLRAEPLPGGKRVRLTRQLGR